MALASPGTSDWLSRRPAFPLLLEAPSGTRGRCGQCRAAVRPAAHRTPGGVTAYTGADPRSEGTFSVSLFGCRAHQDGVPWAFRVRSANTAARSSNHWLSYSACVLVASMRILTHGWTRRKVGAAHIQRGVYQQICLSDKFCAARRTLGRAANLNVDHRRGGMFQDTSAVGAAPPRAQQQVLRCAAAPGVLPAPFLAALSRRAPTALVSPFLPRCLLRHAR